MKTQYEFYEFVRVALLQANYKLILSIFFLCSVSMVYSYPVDAIGLEAIEWQQTVTGSVLDETGTPLIGVTVLVKGTKTGTTTDFDGRFSLQVDTNATLVFSYLGYQTQEVNLAGKTTIDVVMVEALGVLDEVVVIGYGTVKKGDITGSVTSLDSESFNQGAQISVNEMIQGRAAGVQITQSTGAPGAGFSVRIRGANSITAGNEPLYVIDGLPGAPLNALNNGDIESIEILKDASATAIYGSRGANGVILITTKKGRVGQMVVTYDGYTGLQSAARELDLMNAQEYTGFLNGLRAAQEKKPEFSQEEINAAGLGTNWQKEILRSAPVKNHQISLSGGSEQTKYYASMNLYDQDGIVISSGIKRYGARFNIDHKTDRFNFGANVSTTLTVDDDVPLGTGINAAAGVIASAIQMDPTLPIFNADGAYAESDVLDLDNPVALAKNVFLDTKTDRTFGNIFFAYEVLDGLTAKINLGSDIRNSRSDNYLNKVTKRGQSSNGKANISQSRNSSYLMEFTLNYKKIFAEDHSVDIVAGYTYQDFMFEGVNAGSNDFPTDAFLTNNLAAGDSEAYVVGSGKAKNQLLSYLGRVNYGFKNRYLFTASFRADGSSRFGVDNKFGYFPSAAIAWRLSNEEFLADSKVVSNLKLRASYGLTGNQEIGNYNSLILLGTTGEAVYDGTRFVGIAPIQLGNPNLKWETTKQLDIGIDYAFANNRISGTIDYFKKETSDLLLFLPIPSTSGFTNSLQNVGDTENSGFEFLIETKNFVGDFNWTTSLNLATVKNKVTNLGQLPFILQGRLRFLNDWTILREGDAINSYWGYQTDGIFRTQQEIDDSVQPNAQLGDIRFVDIDGDGKINQEDRTILGDPFPDFTMGMNNSFSYKGITLDVFFEGVFGQDMLNFTRIDSENPISFRRNRESFVLDHWTPDNPNSPNPSYINTLGARSVNSRVVEDATYVRLKNLSIGYNFPNLKVDFINNLRVYASGQNLFTITDYSGYNPDVSSFGASNQRVDYNAYPLSRTILLGINIGI